MSYDVTYDQIVKKKNIYAWCKTTLLVHLDKTNYLSCYYLDFKKISNIFYNINFHLQILPLQTNP